MAEAMKMKGFLRNDKKSGQYKIRHFLLFEKETKRYILRLMTEILNKLISRLPKDNLTIIQGNNLIMRNGDVYYPFRQDSDFLYLTGLNVPGLVVTIWKTEQKFSTSSVGTSSEKEASETILWREPITEHDIIWWSDKLSDDELRTISWVEDIRDIGKLEEYCICHREEWSDPGQKKGIPHNDWIASCLAGDGATEISKIQPWQSIIHELRIIKTSEEIAKIQNCIRITQNIYQEVLERVKPWMYEYEIEAIIAYGFRRHHGTEAFPTIVASGGNSCILHYTKNNRQIESGDIVLIDFGIELWGYGADISRTFALWWLSKRQQEIYDAVEDVKKYAENTLKPGITRSTWNLWVKEYMYNTCVRLGLKDIEQYTATTNQYYPHSIGHFLGLDTHDVWENSVPLVPGMVLTIEPGIYIPSESIWIRIEDDYLVTESGCVKL